MTTALVLWLLPTVFTIGFLVGCECCWRWFVVPRRDPNAFGELPPMQPLGDEAERWTYTVVDDGATYVGVEPKLERAVWIATLDPFTREPNGGALPFTIRHNTDQHAGN
jgi:hypothetical protein